MRAPSRKAKLLTVTCPALRLPGGLRAPLTKLKVYYSEHTIGLPWAEVRPLVACAFRHVQREGFRDHRESFLRRSQQWTPELILGKATHGYWWGRNCGHVSRVYVGKLHTEPEKTTYPKFKDMPVFWYTDWKEHMVGLVAHELWHRWQPGHGKPAEFMCELVESDAIDAYRRQQGYTFTPPADPEDKPETETETETETANENNDTPTSAGSDQRMHVQLSVQP